MHWEGGDQDWLLRFPLSSSFPRDNTPSSDPFFSPIQGYELQAVHTDRPRVSVMHLMCSSSRTNYHLFRFVLALDYCCSILARKADAGQTLGTNDLQDMY